MAQDVMDTIIGAEESSQADTEGARRHAQAGHQAAEAGDREAAILEYRKAVSADPNHTESLFHLAYQLDLLGEEDEAVALYERCVATAPAPVNALINLAVLYEDRDDIAGAERCLRQVLDTNPNHPRARLFMKDIQASREMRYDEEHDRDFHKHNALLDMPVTDFELTVRARNCLKKMNIRTLGDLLRVTESELMAYKNFGEASLAEIKEMLAARGLRLGQRVEDQHRHVRREFSDRGRGGVMDKPISDLNLTVRSRKALQALGIRTIGELTARTEAELMGIKNFGQTSLEEVRQKLAEHGLKLRDLEL